MEEQSLFWADQLAQAIINRKKFKFVDKPIPKFKEFTVKTSASLSGVLHIGRLSDTIRSESVYRALKDAKVKAKLIWVAEDMDPLRKIPEGVPAEYEKYIGTSVTDIPDPDGCHKSYADHHKSEYFKVIDEFVFSKMEKFSMREEYKKGNFNKYIKQILEHTQEVIDIQNKYRTEEIKTWFPWKPICDNCGKLSTTNITGMEDGIIKYNCQDYQFEKNTAKGCGHKGENDPLKGNGKLMWKSEWACQWARWNIISEGAGKEYQVPNSAWWVNAEIVERVLGYPMPQPIFYEHLMIDGVKMSASLGNIVYPKDWLEVAAPELLKLFYNKRIMKTRSFSWRDLPGLYDEYDNMAGVFLGKTKLDNKKEESHIKRLFEVSCGKKVNEPIGMTFSHAAVIAQVFPKDEDAVKSLKKTGHYSKKDHDIIFERIHKARLWLNKYAPEDMKFEIKEHVSRNIKLSEPEKQALKLVVEALEKKSWKDTDLHNEFYNICKQTNISPADFFRAAYLVLLEKEKGPRLANFILTVQDKAVSLFKEAY